MREWAWRIGAMALCWGVFGCQGPDEATCRSACSNVVRALASEFQGVDEEALESIVGEAEESMAGCLESCRDQPASHVRCLALAESAKAVTECVGQGF